ncbi:MAG: hypothetical protein M1484_03635 [Patescibacteria group bacterium]|nr:hypothetical protein [Patescibacteria group bacterium]MCL5432152.1 hypothetical protein [Patescibacteria group bacterium]
MQETKKDYRIRQATISYRSAELHGAKVIQGVCRAQCSKADGCQPDSKVTSKEACSVGGLRMHYWPVIIGFDATGTKPCLLEWEGYSQRYWPMKEIEKNMSEDPALQEFGKAIKTLATNTFLEYLNDLRGQPSPKRLSASTRCGRTVNLKDVVAYLELVADESAPQVETDQQLDKGLIQYYQWLESLGKTRLLNLYSSALQTLTGEKNPTKEEVAKLQLIGQRLEELGVTTFQVTPESHQPAVSQKQLPTGK